MPFFLDICPTDGITPGQEFVLELFEHSQELGLAVSEQRRFVDRPFRSEKEVCEYFDSRHVSYNREAVESMRGDRLTMSLSDEAARTILLDCTRG